MTVGAGDELGAAVGVVVGGASGALVVGAGVGVGCVGVEVRVVIGVADGVGASAWLVCGVADRPADPVGSAAGRVRTVASGFTAARVAANVGEAGPAEAADGVVGAGWTLAAGAGAVRANTIAKPTVASAPS